VIHLEERHGVVVDRYQRGLGLPGTMDTEAWFQALLRGIDGPLGDVLDVGCAEGVMCVLAAKAGAAEVTGIGLHDDRMFAAIEAAKQYPNITIREQAASTHHEHHDTVVFSMMAHWLGPDETRRFASLARRNFAVIFRTANEHYAPENGSWFPTLAEMDETLGHPRTSETLLLTQDHGKEVWAATYRTDLRVSEGMVIKGDTVTPFYNGVDLFGDPPFRPTHGKAVMKLSGPNAEAVRTLARNVAENALMDGTYPSDFSPRNVIVNGTQAHLIDDMPGERMPGTHVAPEYLPIWRSTLSSIGLDFDGDLRSLL
jgi:hypothetical protein